MHRVSPFGDRYVYTTHAYLLSLFLDCPPHMGLQCPGPFTRSKVVHGIQSGAVKHSAAPSTQHSTAQYLPSLRVLLVAFSAARGVCCCSVCLCMLQVFTRMHTPAGYCVDRLHYIFRLSPQGVGTLEKPLRGS